MSVDYKLFIIGKTWRDKEYSVKSDFYCGRFRDIWDDLEGSPFPDEVDQAMQKFLGNKEACVDYLPEEKHITVATLKAYIEEKERSLEKEQKKLAALREDRQKSTSSSAFESFTEMIYSAEEMIQYYQEECIKPVRAIIDGLLFLAYDVLNLAGEFYIAVQAWW